MRNGEITGHGSYGNILISCSSYSDCAQNSSNVTCMVHSINGRQHLKVFGCRRYGRSTTRCNFFTDPDFSRGHGGQGQAISLGVSKTVTVSMHNQQECTYQPPKGAIWSEHGSRYVLLDEALDYVKVNSLNVGLGC